MLGMLVVHASRIERVRLPPAGFAELCERAIAASRWAEPFIAASFLFIAGHSLALSRRGFRDGGTGGWLKKILRRAGVLYALSIALFLAQYGIALPDIVVSSGILSAIALALLLVGIALASARSIALLSAIVLIVLGVTAVLDFGGGTVPGLNAGPGGAFPLVAFAAFGALLARLAQARGLRAVGAVTLALLPCTAAALLSGAPWSTERTSHYTGTSAASVLGAVLRGESVESSVAVAFWNHSAIGAVALLFPLCATLWLALAVEGAIRGRRAWAPLLLLGRHALLAYVVHLALLGAIDACGLAPDSPPLTLLLVLSLALFCCALAAGIERYRAAPATAQPCDRAPA